VSNKHLIIAGSNKAGTTSLFHYLAGHPEVAPSRVKELRYFLKEDSQLESYLSHFSTVEQTAITLEASPQYLDAGATVARRIHSVLPDAQLLLMLRNPVDRVRSFFSSYKNRKDKLVEGMSFEQFAEMTVSGADEETDDLQQKEFQRELRRGRYADHIAAYLDIFPANQLHIYFFDQLQSDTAGLVRDVCRVAGIDADHFADYDFTVENRTRAYRSATLQSTAHRVNTKFEALFNRNRQLKLWIRDIYTWLNESTSARPQPAGSPILEDYYDRFNGELSKLLDRHYPEIAQPDWLTQTSASTGD